MAEELLAKRFFDYMDCVAEASGDWGDLALEACIRALIWVERFHRLRGVLC
ncbi:hypothetical protein [Clavavirus yamagawaense]|uniref:Uncharacterized protein n=1 Tax=Aeropyrum pernix bacilliform virus 1 (isolate -/Japan/Tanaka/2005) TaxID=1289471 RepID=D4QF70_APBV1|nr:hypothetical protein FK791_gp04 [Aeropyrum pernix bacilliform virus 1]BAJ06114.1 hypothetical protein [Aeropyrum pernix bacilliform virus 1]